MTCWVEKQWLEATPGAVEVGGVDRVVTSCLFWASTCQNGAVMVWFGLRRGDFGRGGRDKRNVPLDYILGKVYLVSGST